MGSLQAILRLHDRIHQYRGKEDGKYKNEKPTSQGGLRLNWENLLIKTIFLP